LSNTRPGWANAPRWGEGGSAAGSLLSSRPGYTWACVLCRPSPELPFHFVWFLGWSTTPSKVATRLLSGRKRRDGIRTARYVIARHWHLALECSFCNHVYHNTAQCIKVPNIASDESMEVGAHWACPGCWKETCQKAAQWLLVPQQPVKHRRKRRRTQRIQGK
jgi:hypothetical protein